MKLNTLFLAFLAGMLLFSCSSDDGGTTPVDPNPEPENSAPEINAISFSKLESISDEDIIGNVQATDDDGDELDYEITSNSNNLFEIADNGDLSLVSGANLDFEDAQQHVITIQVSDTENQASAQITINVENVIESLFEDSESFITTWKTPADDFELVIGTDSTFDYNFTIDWGDGSDEETFVDLAENPSHVYATEDTYTIAIKGTFPAIKMYEMDNEALGNSQKALLGISQWGAVIWESFEEAFKDCSNLSEYSAEDQPDLSNVQSMAQMFSGAASFNGAIGDWNTLNVVDMSLMFINANAFNQDIGGWKTQNVTNMVGMFGNLADNENSSFNQDISGWDVSKVNFFTNMFAGNNAFDRNLGGWDISSVVSMINMFNDSGMSSENYSNTLIGWDDQGDIPGDIILGATGIKYLCSANMARSNLLGRGWIIDDEGSDPTVCP
ncbi:MAG: BspA family leucine-rich repeat surface protein [Bacteroidota bacterium]